MHDLAVQYNLEDTYKDLIETLIDDGYISNDEEERLYTFTSPKIHLL
jgi:hypothetical protein